MQYPINEMFQTLQGEGYFTGVPAIFIRLQGCPVGCSWCDTKTHLGKGRRSGSGYATHPGENCRE
ncbi:7-carboxy-7-deazaguanine synthase [Serratia fonticola]|uniref:7-carboxy-7-deazaguanine synthase n=1 Tax=Serratia fonticola TaxID=47917 RepID=A0A4U9WGY4_SERFO|nr:7-carboxy-7-deazaguanine synthase [Serratia fonticola]